MHKYFSIMIMATVFAVSPVVGARSVFLNGVDITSVRSQTFKDATVTIDSNGDIRISAPGYKVELSEPSRSGISRGARYGKGGPNASLLKRYYLVTEPSINGRAQYDLIISVNGVEQKIIKAGSNQVIMEISAWLHKGDNEIVLTAKKNLAGGRKSSASSDRIKMLVGTGHEEGKMVKIDSVKAKLKADASNLSNVNKHFVLIAR